MREQLAIGALLIVHVMSIIALLWRGRWSETASDLQPTRTNVARATVARARETTASIANEMAQPLGAIRTNVETAERLLNDPESNTTKLASVLSAIKDDNLRANEIARRWLDTVRDGNNARATLHRESSAVADCRTKNQAAEN